MTSDMPKNIWAWEYKGYSPWGEQKPKDCVQPQAEYIRKDVVDKLVDALELIEESKYTPESSVAIAQKALKEYKND